MTMNMTLVWSGWPRSKTWSVNLEIMLEVKITLHSQIWTLVPSACSGFSGGFPRSLSDWLSLLRIAWIRAELFVHLLSPNHHWENFYYNLINWGLHELHTVHHLCLWEAFVVARSFETENPRTSRMLVKQVAVISLEAQIPPMADIHFTKMMFY